LHIAPIMLLDAHFEAIIAQVGLESVQDGSDEVDGDFG
jgi:hypothetical protein